MYSLRRILVYASLEDEAFLALEQGAALARRHRAALSVLRVLPKRDSLLKRLQGRQEADGIQRALAEGQQALLDARVAPLLEEGLDVHTEVRWGAPWLEVIRTVMRDDHDLLLKTAEGAGSSDGLFFGSTAMRLIRKCPCPVWIVGGPATDRPTRLLAAIDPGQDGDRPAVAARVLETARAVAGEDGEQHVVSVWHAPGEHLFRSRMRPEDLDDYVRAEHEAARESLHKTLSQAGMHLPAERIRLLKGDPRRELPDVVTDGDFDLAVVGSVGRTGVAGLLIGETAETLVRSVRCSVLVVKPAGFTSPVALAPEST